MKPEEIKLGDWQRIFFGAVPPEFYLELVIRAGLVYLLLILSMRLMGKRMATQMSSHELIAMVSLASAIGVPMLAPDRGLLPAFIIGAVVVGATRLISKFSAKNENFEQATQGNIDLLIENSIMYTDIMKKVTLSRERLFAQLRSENIDHLGSVKRLYQEANGSFTLIKNEEPKPGLMVLPDWDKEFINEKLKTTDFTICKNCGAEAPRNSAAFNPANTKCDNCEESEWTKAVIETNIESPKSTNREIFTKEPQAISNSA